jgi:periplasmic protein TonB
MDRGTCKRRSIAVVGALLVNAFLFALLPASVRQAAVKPDLEGLMPVNLVQIRQPKPPPPEPQQRPPEQPEAKKPAEEIPDVSIRQPAPDTSKMKLEVPSLSFEINPKLAGGVAVAPPAAGPTVFAPAPAKSVWDQGEVDQVPLPVSQTKPLYPYRARRLRLDGKVAVRFLVKEDGTVERIEILESAPPGVFDDSVRSALASWRFSPGKVKGKPVCTRVATSIEFKFEDQ